MGSVNKVIVIGNLGKDPEVRYTQGGKAVANFSVAVNESWKDKDGNKQEKTEWINVVVWDKLAENCGKYLAKGRQAYIEGKLQTRKWQDKDGNDRWTTEVVANNVVFLSGAKGDDKPASQDKPAARATPPAQQQKPANDFGYGPPPMDDSQVPF